MRMGGRETPSVILYRTAAIMKIVRIYLNFRQHAVARPKHSPSPSPAATSWSKPLPAATSWSKPLPAATSWSKPLPAVPAWPSSTYGSTYRSSLSNSGMFRELQASECTMGKVVGVAACLSL